jgi:hypothetical protein
MSGVKQDIRDLTAAIRAFNLAADGDSGDAENDAACYMRDCADALIRAIPHKGKKGRGKKRQAAEARDVIEFYTQFYGEPFETGMAPETGAQLKEQNVIDLLADIGHYCDEENLDLQDILRQAANHYNEETRQRGVQFTQSN